MEPANPLGPEAEICLACSRNSQKPTGLKTKGMRARKTGHEAGEAGRDRSSRARGGGKKLHFHSEHNKAPSVYQNSCFTFVTKDSTA